MAAGIVSQFEYFQKLFGDTALGDDQVNASMHKDHAGRFMCKPSEEILLDNFTKKVINTLLLVSSESKIMKDIVERNKFETEIVTTRSDLKPPMTVG